MARLSSGGLVRESAALCIVESASFCPDHNPEQAEQLLLRNLVEERCPGIRLLALLHKPSIPSRRSTS